MIVLGFDSETHLIKPGNLAPRMVCASWATRTEDGSQINTDLMLREPGLATLKGLLRDATVDDYVLTGANLAYDFGVACAEDPSFLPLVFDMYRSGRVRCVQSLQKLIDVAFGMRKFRRTHAPDGSLRVTKSTYSLADLVMLYFGRHVEKIDTWRLRYAELDGVPIAEWPEDAKSYAIGDAVEALQVFEAQQAEIAEHFGAFGGLPNIDETQRSAWVLHLMSMWGVRADEVAVDKFLAHCEEEIDKMREALAGTGILRAGGQRIMKEIYTRVRESCARQHVEVPLTPTGKVVTDKDTLIETDDPALHVLAESMSFVKHKGQWGPVLRAAQDRPVCSRYNELVETGRTSCGGSEGQEGSNMQNPPRKGDVRPAFVPRAGWVYCSTDADTIELRAHAQNCLELVGWSKMAEALWDQHNNGGPDLHVRLGARILGIDPYEAQRLRLEGDEEVVDARQFAKIPNSAFPGGLGAETFISYAAGQLSRDDFVKWFSLVREVALEKAQRHRKTWFETWPENDDYFGIVGKMIDRQSREGTIRQRMSERIRGGVRFTAAANGFFQGRVADAMKEILWRIAWECYVGTVTNVDGSISSTRSVLYGSRPVMFLHDEPILEHPEDGSESERAERQRAIVVEVLSRWLPDIPCTSTAVLMRRWFKGAEPVKVNGLLVPSKPAIVEINGKKKTKWVADLYDERLAA